MSLDRPWEQDWRQGLGGVSLLCYVIGMPRLVEQLQLDAIDSQTAVSTLLRKVKLSAVKLRLGNVADWVQHELSGYDGKVPEYRQVHGNPVAHNPFHGWIPISSDPQMMKIMSRSVVAQSVPEIEDLVARHDGNMIKPFPPEAIHALNRFSDVTFARMGLSLDRSVLTGILDRVRNLVLDWSLDLERAGIMGTEIGFSPEEQRKASQVSVTIGNFSGNFNSGEISGAGAKLLQGSTDRSSNAFSFDALDETIERGVPNQTDRDKLLSISRAMRNSRGDGSFVASYQRFIAEAASYMTILGPFIPGLTGMLGVPSA